MDNKQKGDDFPGSHVVGDRVGDKRVDSLQEQRIPDYNSFQTASSDQSSSDRSQNQPNFEVFIFVS